MSNQSEGTSAPRSDSTTAPSDDNHLSKTSSRPVNVEELGETLVQNSELLQKSCWLSEQLIDAQAVIAPAEVPGFRILEKLGEGKFGSVWLARETNTGKQVAIKFYTNRRNIDWALLSREVEKLAVLYTSRQIVGLLEVGWDYDPPYYVMEYLPNGSLAMLLEEGPLRPAEAVHMTRQIARGLVHAHGSGILHCDLKPANILLDQDLEPRLCDFGQSRLVEEQSHALGTLFYMAPEQADLKAIPDARWDVYALGAMFYHMLVGEPPYRSDEFESLLKQQTSLEGRLAAYRQFVREHPAPNRHRTVPGVDRQLADIIDRSLAIDPARRFPNAQAFLDQLQIRETHRSRRPLFLLGILLPVILLLCMAPLAVEAIRVSVTTARVRLTDRALESDVVSANLLSRSIEREILDRFDELLRIAQYPRVQRTVAMLADMPPAERGELNELMTSLKLEVDDRHRAEGRQLDDSWFLQNTTGVQIWREPASDISLDENFAHRDYFHGLGEEFSAGQLPDDLKPISRPHLSMVYTSATTGRYKVALSVPIFDYDKPDQVIGVLARSIYLGELLVEYDDLLRDQYANGVSRVIALVDHREWKLLAHPWMDDEHLSKLTLQQFLSLSLDPDARNRLQSLLKLNPGSIEAAQFDRTQHYVDPVSQFDPEQYSGHWLAAFSPVASTNWIAIVQERKTDVNAPVEEMRTRLFQLAYWGVVLVFGIVVTTWLTLIMALSERPAKRRRLSKFGLPGLSFHSSNSLTAESLKDSKSSGPVSG
ncbi:Serine/threonine-protein kinase PrkC [Planctopirus ephydatiae]|uniref:Serine/threonine-protein kinase PrkC n=1 Tax=Planctopirus ephydatiae TaxID=2528019 RepID=A0A518GR78_9PLAN|nr:serine/threonine protein kinase [Planctopirus ephydatiae]QDV31106.1 Serine/threonine-protein kinase PrkC [Planctopirus ephydatiae]